MTNQRGVVSLISTTIIALLIMVLTTASATLMVGELKQANDGESTVKSYYAAYSGIEETYAKLAAQNGDPANIRLLNQGCDASPSYQTFLPDVSTARDKVGLTCRLVQTDTTKPNGTIARDKVEQYNLLNPVRLPPPVGATPGIGIGNIVLSWDKSGDAKHDNSVGYPTNVSGTWPDQLPPPMVFTIISSPKNTASATPTDIRSIILLPCVGACDPSVVNFTAASPGTFSATPVASLTVKVPCDNTLTAGASLRCQVSVNSLTTNPAIYDTILRLRPLFSDANYTMQVYDTSSPAQLLSVILPKVHVDINARTGDSFRRVSANIPIQSRTLSILDHVLFANNHICKDFELIDEGGPGQQTTKLNNCALDNRSGLTP